MRGCVSQVAGLLGRGPSLLFSFILLREKHARLPPIRVLIGKLSISFNSSKFSDAKNLAHVLRRVLHIRLRIPQQVVRIVSKHGRGDARRFLRRRSSPKARRLVLRLDLAPISDDRFG